MQVIRGGVREPARDRIDVAASVRPRASGWWLAHQVRRVSRCARPPSANMNVDIRLLLEGGVDEGMVVELADADLELAWWCDWELP